VLTLSSGQVLRTVDAGLAQMDYGDLPVDYLTTLLVDAGARHAIGGLYLGNSVSAESDGLPSVMANGDVSDDGVVLTPGVNWQAGPGGASVDVTVTGGSGYLSAWVDWDQNNSFSPGERILTDQFVNAGSQTITFTVPATITFGNTFNVRFRLYAESTSGAAQTVGLVLNGEVEDYQWQFGPTAVRLERFTVRRSGWHEMPWYLLLGVLPIVPLVWKRRKN